MATKHVARSLVILACSVGLAAGIQGQEAEGKVKVGDTEGKASIDVPDRGTPNSQSASDKFEAADRGSHVAKVNKATGLLGMSVKNMQNEKLGSINEIVLDLNSGRVGYAVLSIGGFLGIGDKLVAVPVDAFTVSPEQDSLIIDADKARLKEMPALTKEWPEINDPQIAAHWKMDSSAVGASSGSAEVGQARGENRELTDTKASSRIDANKQPLGEVFTGKITMIDPEKRLMRVEGENESREFTFTDQPTLFVGRGSQNANLIDFKVGYRVQVGYHHEGDNHVAHRVTRTDAPGTR